MAIYYVRSGATGLNNGSSWTDAYTTFAAALGSIAANDFIYVAHDHAEDLGADTIYTINQAIVVVCVNTVTNNPTTGARIGHTTSNRSITINASSKVLFYGIKFQVAGTLVDSILLNNTSGGHVEYELCDFFLLSTAASCRIILGVSSAASAQNYTRLRNCTLKFGSTSQGLIARQKVDIEELTIDATGSIPTTLFVSDSSTRGGPVYIYGSDLSPITTLVAESSGQAGTFNLFNCKLAPGVVVYSAGASSNKSGQSVNLYDCSSGDQHYHMAHYDAMGSTVVETGIYANDNPTYDGTNKCSWKITTTANCSYYTPYCSPWITKYNDTLSSVTPYIEILRDGSTTALQNDEVWPDFFIKTTAGSTKMSMYKNKMELLGTPTNIPDGMGTSNWVGETASAWSGKLQTASTVTPAEIGDIAARICVGEPSLTIFVDPQIRGV